MNHKVESLLKSELEIPRSKLETSQPQSILEEIINTSVQAKKEISKKQQEPGYERACRVKLPEIQAFLSDRSSDYSKIKTYHDYFEIAPYLKLDLLGNKFDYLETIKTLQNKIDELYFKIKCKLLYKGYEGYYTNTAELHAIEYFSSR